MGELQRKSLQEVGDKCLLFSGLFPECAERKRVTVGYFVQVGQIAYEQLSLKVPDSTALVFEQLCEGFINVMDVLQSMRPSINQRIQNNGGIDFWKDNKSKEALKYLEDIEPRCIDKGIDQSFGKKRH